MCAMVFDGYGGPDVLFEERARSGAAKWGRIDPRRCCRWKSISAIGNTICTAGVTVSPLGLSRIPIRRIRGNSRTSRDSRERGRQSIAVFFSFHELGSGRSFAFSRSREATT